MPSSLHALLGAHEPDPVEMLPGRDNSPFLLTCDHAGRLFPEGSNRLEVSESDARAHIAWDIGAAGVARELARKLSAPLISQRYSRLLIDCNRPPAVASSIPEISEYTSIPGNLGLSAEARRTRYEQIFLPYHQRIAAELDRRAASGWATVLISVHSFTPVFKGQSRELDIGILFNRDPRLARLLLQLLAAESGIRSIANEPYRVSDQTDYTIPVHGEARGIPHVMIEIRNSLIEHEAQQLDWARRFAGWLYTAHQRLEAQHSASTPAASTATIC